MAQDQATRTALTGALILLAAAAPAQELPQRLQPQIHKQPQPNNRRPFDRVIGIFGDEAILESSIRVELDSRLAGLARSGRRITREEVALEFNRILRRMIQERALAASAESLPGSSREKVDQIVDYYLDDMQRQEEQKAGSLNALSEQLGLLGQTWESYREAERTRRRGMVASQLNLQLRYRDRFALAVTPLEVRQFFDEHRDEFEQEPSADLAVIAIQGGADPDASLARAQQLAAAWRAEPRPAEDLAAEFGGFALEPRHGVSNTPDDSNAPQLKQFAARGAEGDVSEPLRRGNTWWVVRIERKNAGIRESFDDPEVQAAILNLLVEQKINAENERLVRKSGDRYEPRAVRIRR